MLLHMSMPSAFPFYVFFIYLSYKAEASGLLLLSQTCCLCLVCFCYYCQVENYRTAMLICLRGFIDKDHYVMVFRMFPGQ